MKNTQQRRKFLKSIFLGGTGIVMSPGLLKAEGKVNAPSGSATDSAGETFNQPYTGDRLRKIAFPIGGMGAGMFCLEGSGAISHMSIRNRPGLFNEPPIFAAIAIKGHEHGVKVLEGPVPEWKKFGLRGGGNGDPGATYGLPRFRSAEFTARFPFAEVRLQDEDIPLAVTLTGWSPFIPNDEDNSGLPAGALEYTFKNESGAAIEAVLSFNSKQFLADTEGAINRVTAIEHGFVLNQSAAPGKPESACSFAVWTDDVQTIVDHCWFRGGWWDPLTMAWNTVRDRKMRHTVPVEKDAPGASLFVPFTLQPGATKTIRLMTAWYTPYSDWHIGETVAAASNGNSTNYRPWYSNRFDSIEAVAKYWREKYSELREKSQLFSHAFYSSTLPAEVTEAVAANLTILKSPTVLRAFDGRFWAWEGSGEDDGSCEGTCTHVWNYAQALPHLFPRMERSIRHTEFGENQNEQGHQRFRANMPISPVKHDFHAASDGQLGGIMKVYREWRISGDDEWLRRMYPAVMTSMNYCISTWDPKSKGVIEEPHHNTYDIEFWGPDGMITSFYLGALTAITLMGKHLGKNISKYSALYAKGKKYLETQLFDGEYFFQEIEYKNLQAENPAKAMSFGGDYSAEALEILQQEGPKYQYGKGCLSDGILGAWLGSMCGLPEFVDEKKVSSHLLAVHTYNLKKDLTRHANPQRPGYAIGEEGGLLLCTWPKGGKLSLPFVYSDEVWTGIEYQVASHLILTGHVAEGLEIVRTCRSRYDGRVRNPFNEYECGSWYARAMSSYGLLQALTGVRYDAVDKTLYVRSRVGDFTSFLGTATGFGTVRLAGGKATVEVVQGSIEVVKTVIVV